MSMTETVGCLEGLVNNGITEDEELGILNILENLEDAECVEDWDASKSQFLGPIPSDLLMGPPMIPPGRINTVRPSHLQSHPAAAVDRKPKQKVQESRTFQIQSPVSVLESNGPSSSSKCLPIKFNIVIPARARSRRVKPSGPNPWLSISPFFESTPSTFKKTKRYKEMRKKTIWTEITVKDCEDDASCPAVTKKCSHCQISKTPQWREGPCGPKTLCNACGVRYRSGRLFPEYRPAASPTFVPSLHSNSHKKVIEMRNKGKQQQMTRVMEIPISMAEDISKSRGVEVPVSRVEEIPIPLSRVVEIPVSRVDEIPVSSPQMESQSHYPES